MTMYLKLSLGLLLYAALMIAAVKPSRRPKLAGGWQKANKSSPAIQEAAQKATVHLESARNSAKAYRLVEVINAKQQVVAGMNYNITLKIGRTDCSRNTQTNLADCPFVTTQKCKVTVWVRAWLNSSQVTHSDCEKEKVVKKPKTPKTPKPMMPGGETTVDPSDEGVVEATGFAMTEISTRSNGRYTVQHQRVIEATSQVVAGAMYRIKVQVSVTDTQTKKVKATRCSIKVWDQPWRTPRFTLEEYKCDKYIA